MTTLDLFQKQLAFMNEQLKYENDKYVRIEVLGVEVVAISKAGDSLMIQGFDENNLESVLIFPTAHFSAKLTFAPKIKERPFMGFKSI